MSEFAVHVLGLTHQYGERTALNGVSFSVAREEIFGLLGPNGGGKTTLFRVLSTLLRPTSGAGRIFGHDVVTEPAEVRRHLGVVFQHPSLDPKLTVIENVVQHGHLYGCWGRTARSRANQLLERFGLADRTRDRVETLSGGLKRRVELAKALLPRPTLLLLDEPSTGLDPGARRQLTHYLETLRREERITILLTTHILDEAERCDRLGILDRGRLVALDTPDALRARLGGDVVAIQARDPEGLGAAIARKLGIEPQLVDGSLRAQCPQGHEFARKVMEAFPDAVTAVSFGKPTLEDVFISLTGRRLWEREDTRPA
jgi:ABC-2 type transport system ATP-binding protein